jgi:hypothetical protein
VNAVLIRVHLTRIRPNSCAFSKDVVFGSNPLEFDSGAVKIGVQANSPIFEIALVLVRLDHVTRGIVNANHRIM